MHRFYVPGLGTENVVWIEGDEARHLVLVLRAGVGDEVALFDGRGIECLGVVDRLERGRAKVAILQREAVSRDPDLGVTLACSAVKAKAMDLLVEKCAEMGLRELIPVESRRSVPKLDEREANHVERWERTAVEASKQCGRTTLTRIAAPRPLSALLARGQEWDLRLIFSPGEDALPLKKVLTEHPRPRSAIYAIGPEGGFERAELREAGAAGFEQVRLGRSTLRTETAAVAALAAILYHYEDGSTRDDG
jgi:16S rRNA (uracil1498-N3)-methyltransferase